MFPRFSDMLNYLFGTHWNLPVQTYGFFLALAFLVGATVLYYELKRKEKEGLLLPKQRKVLKSKPPSTSEILLGAIITFLLAWKVGGIVTDYPVFAANPQRYLTSASGNLLLGILAAAVIIVYEIIRQKKLKNTTAEYIDEIIHPADYTWNILIIAVVAALIGSKLFDIFDNFGDFLRNPVGSLLSFSGLTFYGGLIVTVITLLWYLKKIHLDWHYVIDAAAPAIMIGYAVGRLGCQFSGDGCWGIVNTMAKPGWLTWLPDWLWSFNYPHNVLNEGIPIADCGGRNCRVLAEPVFPTPLYESLVSFIWFGVLWLCRKKIKAPVVLFGIYMVLNGVERFFIEKIRVNNRFDFLGMNVTQAEIISFCLFVGGIFIIWRFSRKYRQNATGENQKTIV